VSERAEGVIGGLRSGGPCTVQPRTRPQAVDPEAFGGGGGGGGVVAVTEREERRKEGGDWNTFVELPADLELEICLAWRVAN
jgi:hypothetical protein